MKRLLLILVVAIVIPLVTLYYVTSTTGVLNNVVTLVKACDKTSTDDNIEETGIVERVEQYLYGRSVKMVVMLDDGTMLQWWKAENMRFSMLQRGDKLSYKVQYEDDGIYWVKPLSLTPHKQ